MYGTPYIKNEGDKWVAVQFKSTLLRVGSPWAECTGADIGPSSYSLGMIAPILFGGPNLNSIALLAGNPSYLDVIDELQGVTVPVKVVLEIFPITAENKDRYTDSNDDTQCYRVGRKLLAFAKLVSHTVHGIAGCLVSWSDGSRIDRARHEFTCSTVVR